jgi:hypothetical protein
MSWNILELGLKKFPNLLEILSLRNWMHTNSGKADELSPASQSWRPAAIRREKKSQLDYT